MSDSQHKLNLVRFVWLGLLATLWVSACTLLDDVPCKQDSDCPAYMGCYHGVQCLPTRWIEQKRALDEQRPQEPVAIDHKDAAEPLTELIAESQVEARPEELTTPDTNDEMQPESRPEVPNCPCVLGEQPTPCFPEKLKGCNTDGSGCKGLCQPGTKRCIQLAPGQCPEWDKCENHTPPNATESCNGIDDNCDGNVDEGCLCQDGQKQPCYPHNAGCKQVGTSFTCTAPCEAGEQTCQDGKWGPCSGDKGPGTELCDNKDNNCDGMIDEAFPNQGKACKTTEKGICEAGTTACIAGKEVCKATNTPTTEVCGDGKDNDCDGKTDEGCVSVFVGTGQIGKVDGPGNTATFNLPESLTFDKIGNLYVADTGNHVIRKIDTTGNVTTFAGTGVAGTKDGAANQAEFSSPRGIACDANGNLYVADAGNNKIRKITQTQQVSTFAGTGASGSQNGNATQATFARPKAIAITPTGEFYVSDNGNHVIRKIDTTGNVTTFAGSGNRGFVNGASTQARFNFPQGNSFDSFGNLYVADQGNDCIRQIDPLGNVSTFAGTGVGGDTDGPSDKAQFNRPVSLAFGPNRELYVADSYNCKIRKITPLGLVTTFVGNTCKSSLLGPTNKAELADIQGIIVDTSGNIYAIEKQRILKITPE